jgi:hypothetical protein
MVSWNVVFDEWVSATCCMAFQQHLHVCIYSLLDILCEVKQQALAYDFGRRPWEITAPEGQMVPALQCTVY